jgi:hypothetical protein
MVMSTVTPGRAYRVDVEEIKKAKKVEFQNYRGKLSKKERVTEIRAIGKKLAGAGDKGWVRFHMKYSLIHARSGKDTGKLGADIFSIDKDARVGHVKNIRRIIAGYLSAMYGYSSRDAGALALFLTYYNAVYRGDVEYLNQRYRAEVMKHVNRKNAGLAMKYTQWPGNTRMLIPVTSDPGRGRLDSIDADIITGDHTRREIRKDDTHIPERKDMVDLKKRVLEKDKKKLREEKRKLKEEKRDLEEKRKEQEEQKRDVAEEKKKTPGETTQGEIKKKEEEIKKEEKEIRKKEREVVRKEDRIEQEEEEITEREEKLKEEEKEIEEDELRRDIAKEPDKAKKKLLEKEAELDAREDRLREEKSDEKIFGLKLYYLKINEYLEGGHYNNELIMIDAASRKVLFSSPVTNICGRKYDVFSGGVIVITHLGSHKEGHRLTLVDRETLKALKHGSDHIFWRSFVEVREGSIYAILYDDGRHFLGRFNEDLKLVARSKVEIDRDTFISFFEDSIYINRKDKAVIVLQRDDLSLVGEVAP